MEGTTALFNSEVITGLVDIVEQMLGIATTFPLNVFLTASMVGIGIGIIRSLKSVVA